MKSSAVLLLTLLLQTGSGQGYKWPTDASTALTSSFGEFRPRHYHAAIDIKTWNRTGYRIFAIDDGYIMRARISAFGYGKALYLKLKDGNIVVYAHLSNFWPELESYMDNYRREKRIYEADLHFTSGQFPVKKGQTLGRTGRTGIGYPHLHFEIRNPNNMPVNPLQYYPNTIKDNIPPRLYEVALFPHDHKSTLNLKTDTLFYPLNGDHTVSLRDTLLLSGKICLALKVYDQADGVSNRFSFYQSRMWIDDSLVYSVKYDIFSYALSYKVELDKNFSQWRKGNGIFHNYYRHRLNNLPHYGSTPGEGGIINTALLTEGIHDLKIEITDFAGNISLFEMSFFSGEIPVLHYDLLRWLENDLYLRLQTSEKMDSILVQSKSKDGKWTSEKINRSVSGPTLNETYQYTFSVSPSQPSQTEWL
ncbi:MAG: M23 family metallopeptidase, partial [Calditrichaeota bacterium]|nr:M23 family metallopeptidase [Calditrichota bacterium]